MFFISEKEFKLSIITIEIDEKTIVFSLKKSSLQYLFMYIGLLYFSRYRLQVHTKYSTILWFVM
jgi:hypothetical protein